MKRASDDGDAGNPRKRRCLYSALMGAIRKNIVLMPLLEMSVAKERANDSADTLRTARHVGERAVSSQ